MPELIAALAVFVGTHFLMSHPLRASMVSALGANGFQIVYSLVSIASFVWIVMAYGAAPEGDPAWSVGDGIWWIATVLMLIGSILFAGSLIGNPAMPAPGAAEAARKPARGVFAITRHPMMWGFAIWSLVHVLVSPTPAMIALSAGLAILALGGSAGQDRKKAALMGDDWADWSSRTSFIPLARQLSGAAPWKTAWPGRTPILAGTLIWLAASWAHPWWGAPVAGLWRWL